MRVLEHGVNIEVEKPMCIDLEQADAVIAKAESKGVKVAVHQQSRAGPNMQATFRAFQQGRIGRLRYITGSGKGYYGGYGLMNIGTHMLNNMLQFGERCRSVSAVALTDGRTITPEDVHTSPAGMGTITGESITATLQFGDNVTGTLLQHRFPVRAARSLLAGAIRHGGSAALQRLRTRYGRRVVDADAAPSPRWYEQPLGAAGGRSTRSSTTRRVVPHPTTSALPTNTCAP